RSQLAAGGYGAIYRLDPDDRRQGDDLPPLVVKLPLSDEPNAKAEALEDFRKEAEIYAKIGDHPNILKCLGLRKVGDAEGLVMEAVRGTTTDKFFADLRARAAEGELSEAEFWSTIQYTIGKTMSALAHIHEAGLAHNDLKPQNIMIDQVTGDVKVIDVGTANLQGEVVEGVDNPIFQAPEQLKKQGSSGQTDALPVGGVAYTAATGQGFHFGDKDGMMSAFMADIDEAMLKYGARRGDDADDAAISLATEEETVRSVNRRGEDDPKGDILLRDPSKSAGRSAYTDFINAIMHPDPTKRLSPKQALEHPFLRDPMLPEEQVRAVIQDASKGKALPGEEPLRERLGDVFRKSAAKVDAWDDRIAELKETLKLDPTAVPGDKLIAKREELAKQLETLDSDRVQIQRAIDVLKDLIANAREKSTEIYFNDNKNLDRLRKQDSVMRELRPGLAALLVAVKDAFDLWTVDELAETINADEVQKRIAGLQASREALAQEVDDVVNHPAPALFDHLRHLDRLQRQVETVRSNAAVEKKLLLNLARRKPTTPELKQVSKQLSDHFQLLAPIVDEVKRARDDAVRHAAYLERKINETLVPEYEALATTFETLKQAHAATTNEFEEIVMAPRDTPDAMLAFEKARNEFDVDEDAYQDRLADLIAKAEKQQANVLKQQKELGKLGVTGVANPLNTLSKLYKSLSRLKVKMTV
ncbi:MAG TPA: protein kinase, partial [Pirellulaceae bacterium]|nr:protein kinase [Pirellulaceae bacterium]